MLLSTNLEANKWHPSLFGQRFLKKKVNILGRRILENADISEGHFSAIEKSVSIPIEFVFKSMNIFSIEVPTKT